MASFRPYSYIPLGHHPGTKPFLAGPPMALAEFGKGSGSQAKRGALEGLLGADELRTGNRVSAVLACLLGTPPRFRFAEPAHC